VKKKPSLLEVAKSVPMNPSRMEVLVVTRARKVPVGYKATHHEYQRYVRPVMPCTAAHMTFGGKCLNCGYEPDAYVPNEHTLAGFVAEHRITMTTARADSNPNMDGSQNMDHWHVTLKHAGRRMTLVFSKGHGHNGAEPTATEVLACIQGDATYGDMPFEEWARDLGYDIDSRKAERTHNAVVRQTERARKLIGDVLWTDFLDARED